MKAETLNQLLEDVAAGRVSPAQARERLAELPFVDLGFAKLDSHREVRSGVPEAIFAPGKTLEELETITEHLLASEGRVLLTRLDEKRGESLARRFPQAVYHPRARLLTCGPARERSSGLVTVLAAGTSDLPVAEEAALCARWFGCRVESHSDVGVAGLHRLLERLAAVRQAQVVVAVAGMDGALPTLVTGLVQAPVIAVPTSVGYGASFEGLAALLTMLNACAPGLAVVNIDNGYGAAVLARRILYGTGSGA